MLKWFKRTEGEDEEAPAVDDLEQTRIETGEWVNDSLETLAFILRIFGRSGFDTSQRPLSDFEAECDQWSNHLLEGRGPSDWTAIRHFFREARDEEYRHVASIRDETKELVAELVSGLRTALEADVKSDAKVANSIDSLREAVTSGNLEQLRRRAGQAVNAVQTEIRERSERHQRELERMSKQVAKIQGDLAAARVTAQIDGLTQVYNRASFDEFLAATVKSSSARKAGACLMMVDVDKFKPINDSYGHRVGDTVLRAVADAVTKSCRKDTSIVARYGGDEFAVILKGSPIEGARNVATRFINAVRSIRIPLAPELRVTLSIGIAKLERNDDVEAFISRADEALYEAKRAGRDQHFG